MEYKKKLAALRRKKGSLDAYTFNAELYKLQLHSPLIDKKIEKLKKLYPGLADECYEQERQFATVKRIDKMKEFKPVKKVKQVSFMSVKPTKGEQKLLSGRHREKIVPDSKTVFLTQKKPINSNDKDILYNDYGVPYTSYRDWSGITEKALLSNRIPVYIRNGLSRNRIIIFADKNEILKVFTKLPDAIYEKTTRHELPRYELIEEYIFKGSPLPIFTEYTLDITGKKKVSVGNAYVKLSALGYGDMHNIEYTNIKDGKISNIPIYYKAYEDTNEVIVYVDKEYIKNRYDITPKKASINDSEKLYDVIYRYVR